MIEVGLDPIILPGRGFKLISPSKSHNVRKGDLVSVEFFTPANSVNASCKLSTKFGLVINNPASNGIFTILVGGQIRDFYNPTYQLVLRRANDPASRG